MERPTRRERFEYAKAHWQFSFRSDLIWALVSAPLVVLGLRAFGSEGGLVDYLIEVAAAAVILLIAYPLAQFLGGLVTAGERIALERGDALEEKGAALEAENTRLEYARQYVVGTRLRGDLGYIVGAMRGVEKIAHTEEHGDEDDAVDWAERELVRWRDEARNQLIAAGFVDRANRMPEVNIYPRTRQNAILEGQRQAENLRSVLYWISRPRTDQDWGGL
jgi:hypothetical protein